MNLERFPTNTMAQEMMEWITGNGYYDNSYIAKWLFQVLGMEMEEASYLFEEVQKQMFPETATWGIAYHEQKYGLPVNEKIPPVEHAENLDEEQLKKLLAERAVEHLNKRREIVIQKRNVRPPMNPARMKALVASFINKDPSIVHVEENIEPGVFRITINGESLTGVDYPGLLSYVKKLKPSHLSFLLQEYQHTHVEYPMWYDADMRIRSEYPIRNIPVLEMDGSWFLDGNYYLQGVMIPDYHQIHPVNLGLNTDTKVNVRNGSRLTVEKNLFYLDENWMLNGDKILDAAVLQYEDL